jgi:hypothetical protein
MVGSSAGALIGLQFVVMTLVADIATGPGAAQAGSAFGTPTIVHFGAVLLLSGIQCAPWPSVASICVAWGVLGLAGLSYVAIVVRRMRSQDKYRPEFEDWIFHVILPLLAYGSLGASAMFGPMHEREMLFAVAAAALLLLFASIHNAWDAVTYHIYHQRQRGRDAETAHHEQPDASR